MNSFGPQVGESSVSPPGARTIVYVTMSLDIGGTEKHLSLVVPRLRARGWTPIVYCLWRRGRFASVLEEAGIEVIGRDAPDRAARDWKRDGLYLAGAWLRLAHLVARRKPQIMHFFLPLAYMLGAPLAILLRVPVKVMSRRSLNTYQGGQSGVHRIERFLHARMNAVVANSKRVARDLIESEGCPPDKVGLIYNGTDLSAVSAAARDESSGEGQAAPPLTLIIVANLIPYKGHADLLTALGGIASQLPQGWRILCAGRDEGCGRQLVEQAGQLGIGANVHFLGERSDVPQLLKTADIGILCSHQEGFSNAVIEGLAAGLPMVVTDVGGNAEAVADDETGLVVPPHDPAALGRAILALAMEPERRRKMGRAAREDAVRRFSIESCVDHYDRLYRGLIDHKLPGEIRAFA
jgi:glycosyltransferase involved in cell wall biosynthesis